jgi:hypothetical protein
MGKADRYCGSDFNLHHCDMRLDLVVVIRVITQAQLKPPDDVRIH